MEWPKELLDIFDDPLFDDVHPKPEAPMAIDLLERKLVEINEWMDNHEGKEPSLENGEDITEKCLAASLWAIRKDTGCHSDLKRFDRLKLLEE
jgi:hypothetical protein